MVLHLFVLGKSGQLLVVFLGVGLEGKEGHVVAQDVELSCREVEVESVGDFFVAGSDGLVENAVAPAGLGVLFLLVEVDGHVGVEHGLDVCDFGVVDVVLVDLFGNDVESHVVLLLKHDLHLVENELQLLSLVHRPVGLDLHLL